MKSILRKATALFLSMLMCISGIPLNALAETMTDVSRAFTLANTAEILRLVLDPSSAVIPVGGTQVFTPTLEGGASIMRQTANGSQTIRRLLPWKMAK